MASLASRRSETQTLHSTLIPPGKPMLSDKGWLHDVARASASRDVRTATSASLRSEFGWDVPPYTNNPPPPPPPPSVIPIKDCQYKGEHTYSAKFVECTAVCKEASERLGTSLSVSYCETTCPIQARSNLVGDPATPNPH